MRKNLFAPIIASIIVLTIVVLSFFQPYHISGDCMEPAIMDGTLFLNRVLPYFRGYKTGDIVMYKHDNKIWISRIVALENNTIQISDDTIAVNNVTLKDKIQRNWSQWKFGTYAINKAFHIPVNHVFVLSDNLSAHHDDSRIFGPIAYEAILGIVW